MKVVAIESLEKGELRSYGEGKYLGDKVPDVSPFKEIKLKSPCIKLDSGKHVWGFQCWWGDINKFRKCYKNVIQTEIIVDIEDEILPIEE